MVTGPSGAGKGTLIQLVLTFAQAVRDGLTHFKRTPGVMLYVLLHRKVQATTDAIVCEGLAERYAHFRSLYTAPSAAKA